MLGHLLFDRGDIAGALKVMRSATPAVAADPDYYAFLAAERLGYDSTLIAQHTINPHQEDFDQLEAWSAAAAIAAWTWSTAATSPTTGKAIC